MAEKRMFSRKITESDDFTDMPGTAQALYFHLNQGADDDGFNNQVKHAMLYAHASPDDLKMLLAKNFILRFESGVIVIKHWWMHNTLRKDRYTPTNFQEELALLGVKDNKSYTISDKVQVIESNDGNQMATTWQPNDNRSATQNSIGKDSIDKDSIYTVQPEAKNDVQNGSYTVGQTVGNALDGSNTLVNQETIDIRPVNQPKKILSSEQTKRFEAFWKAYPKKQSKATAEKAWSKILPDDFEMNVILQAIEQAKQKDSRFRDMQYIPLPATWLNARSWENEYEDDPYPQPQATARPQRSEGMGSFDADEFFNAAVNRRRKG